MENTPPKKKKALPFILAIIVIGSLIFGISKYIYARHHEDTDDAQLDADVSPVLSRVSGYIKEIRFEDNQLVKKGDTLLKIDESDFIIRLAQSNAALENANAGISVAKANVASAQASIDAAKSVVDAMKIRVWKSKQDFDRYQELLNTHAVTAQQFETAKAEKESAEAAMQTAIRQQQTATMQMKTMEQQVGVTESMKAQRQADVDYAKLQLSYINVIAPANGIATKKNVQLGQLVNAGSPLCAIVNDSNIYVTANFKETQLTRMKEGLTVEVIADAFPDEKIEGKVYRLSAATGARFSLLPPDNATGNYVKVVQRIPVKIKLNGSRELLSRLKPGMSVKVSVKLD